MCLSRFKPADWNKFLDVVIKWMQQGHILGKWREQNIYRYTYDVDTKNITNIIIFNN